MLPDENDFKDPKLDNRSKIAETLCDDLIPSITLQVTGETIRLEYSLTDVVSVETLANMGASLIRAEKDILNFMAKDAEKAGISNKEFVKAIASYLYAAEHTPDRPDDTIIDSDDKPEE